MTNRFRQKIRLHCNPLIRSLAGAVGRNGVNARIAVSRRWRFIYYRVPKAANSTVIRTIAAHEPGGNYDDNWTAQQVKERAYLLPTELGIVNSFSARNRYHAFAFVRNPYTRVLSAYLDKVANDTDPRSHIRARRIRVAIGANDDEPVSFGDFVRYLDAGGIYGNIHWAPQTSLVPPDVHFVGYFESLEVGLAELVPRLFPGVEFRQSESWLHHRTGADGRLDRYYSTLLRHKIANLYKRDFDRFGYDR